MGRRMTELETLIGYLDDLLKPRNFEDYGPNGLQVPGRPQIRVVATGVSAGAELFERAAAENADLVLVHHGLFWKGAPRGLDRPARRRLQLLFDADMSLVAYHLPHDGHPEHGNNALLAAGLGAELTGPFADGIGVSARWPAARAPEELTRPIPKVTGREPLAVRGGPDTVGSIAIVSGGGQGYLA